MIFRPLVLAALCSIAISSLPNPAEAEDTDQAAYYRPSLGKDYRHALSIDPDNLNLRHHYGMALLEADKYHTAAAELSRAYPAFIHCAETSYLLGVAHGRAGDIDSALLYLEQAETLGATRRQELLPLADTYYNLAQPLLEADRLEEAAALFAKALMLSPDRKEIHRLLGEIYIRSGRVDKAMVAFAVYLATYPGDAETAELVYTLYFKEALKLLETREHDAARKVLERALAANPRSPLAIYYLGYLEYSQGRYEQAAARLSPIYETSPADIRRGAGMVLYNSAVSLLEQRKPHEALTALAPLTAQDAASTKSLYLAGNIHLTLKEYVAALNCFRRVLAQEPLHRGATMNIVAARAGATEELLAEARAHLHQGKLRKAMEKLEAVLTIRPDHAEALGDQRRCRAEMEIKSGEHFARAEKLLCRNKLIDALAEINAGLGLSPIASYGMLLKQEIMEELAGEILTRLEEGDRLRGNNRQSEADAHYAGVLELDPDNERAHQGRRQTSLALRKKAAELALRGTGAMEEGDLAAARTNYNLALQFDPQQSEATGGLVRIKALHATMLAEKLQWGRRAASAGRWREATGYLTEALSLRDAPEIRRELAAVERKFTDRLFTLIDTARKALEANEFHRSRYYFLEALALAPDSPDVQTGLDELEARAATVAVRNLAEAQRRSVDGLDHGLAFYRRVLEIDPANEKALSGVKEALARLNEDLAAQVAAGRNAAMNGELEEAEEVLRDVLARDPWHAEARRVLERLEGTILAAHSASPAMERIYEQGLAFYSRQRYDDAVETWRQVPTSSSRHDAAHANIARALRKTSPPGEGRQPHATSLQPGGLREFSAESADISSFDTAQHRPVQTP